MRRDDRMTRKISTAQEVETAAQSRGTEEGEMAMSSISTLSP